MLKVFETKSSKFSLQRNFVQAKQNYFHSSDEKTYSKEYYEDHASKSLSTDGTAHISVVDEYGDAVAITSTINT